MYFKAFLVIFVETLFTTWQQSINQMLWQKKKNGQLLSKSNLLLLLSPTLPTLALWPDKLVEYISFLIKETCIVYIHVYLLAVFFFTAFVGALLRFL